MNIYDIINNKKFWIVRHAAFWIVMYLDEVLSVFGITDPIEDYGTFAIGILLDIFMVYFNLYYLIPKFFQKGDIKNYILLTLLTLVINLTLLNVFAMTYFEEDSIISIVFGTFLYTIGLLGIAVSIKISKITQQKMIRLNELQKLQHETELDNLKKQVNPHFLFNALNSIYVLAKENPNVAPESILKLSDLMRYQTYDAAKQKVGLTQEINFIYKYLDLEKMRRDHLKTDIQIKGDMNNIPIPPLLFLPFVENACKYSNSISGDNDFVNIVFDHKGTDLFFEIENNQGDHKGFLQDAEYSGVGLENIRKRMKILFPENHKLEIKETTETYKAKLIIKDIHKI